MVTERTEFDIKRFGNFISSPKGLMFIAKQEVLARQQSKLPPSIFPTRIYNPVSTGLEIGGVAFGLHVNGKGLTPVPFSVRGFTNSFKNALTQSPSTDNTSLYLYQTRENYNRFDPGLGENLSTEPGIGGFLQNAKKKRFGTFLF